MATKGEIAELSIGIGLNDSKFSSQVSNINKQIKNMDRDLKSASNGVKGFENSFVGLNSKVQNSANQIELYNKKLDSQKKEYDRLNGTLDRQRNKLTELETSLGRTSKEYKQQEQLIQKTASKMTTLDSQITQTNSHLTRLGTELNDATRDMEKMANKTLTIEQRLASVGQRADLANSQFDRLGAELAGTGNFMNRLGNDMQRLSNEIQQGGAKIAIYEAELNKLGGELQQNSVRQLELATSIQQVEEELMQVSAIYGNTSQEAQQLSNKLLGLKDDFNRNEHEIEQNTQALNRYQTELNQTEASVIRAGNSLRTMPFDRVGNSLKNVGNGIRSAGYSLLPLTYGIGAVGAGSAKVALDLESAFAGVRKTMDTSGLSAEQADKKFEGLKSSIMEMSKRMPTSAVEIAKVAENAGQLGIKSENVLGFTETMVKLGDTTNLSADEASSALAKLANITGMPQENFDRLGSTIVALGNNMATTEADISAMALRLAGAGSQVGMSEDEILSFSSALSSVGIEAEAGGSAFSKVMIDMQLATETGGEKLENFAKVAGMSSSEFSKAFKEDAPTAIMAFIEGLGKAEENGQSAIGILDSMGISEVRLRDTLLRASGASDLFSKALGIGSKAWSENNALTKEAQVRYETTASKIAMAKNRLIETGQKIGQILLPVIADVMDKIASLGEKFSGLDESQQKTIVKLAGVAMAIAPVLIGLGSIMNLAGTATTAFGALAGGTSVLSGIFATFALPVALLGLAGTIGESETALDFLQDKFGVVGSVIGGVCEGIAGQFQLTFGNLLILVGGVAKGISAIFSGEFWKVDDIMSETWASVENNTAKALSNTRMESSRALDLLENTTKEKLTGVKSAFDMALKELPNVTEKNLSQVSKKFADNFSKLDNDSLTILRGTSDTMAMLFEGIYEGMSKDDASKKFNANLESMNKGGKLDGVKEDVAKAMDLINRNVSDGSTQVKQSASDMFNSIKDSSKIGMDEAVSNVVGQLGSMNQETLTQLTSMGSTWKSVFNGINLDGSMSTQQMKDTVMNNMSTLEKNGVDVISMLRNESATHWKGMETDANTSTANITQSFDKIPKEVVTQLKSNGIESESEILKVYNLYEQLPKEIQTYIKADNYQALVGATSIKDVLANIPVEKRVALITDVATKGNMPPKELEELLKSLPNEERVRVEAEINNGDKVKDVKKDVEDVPKQTKAKVDVDTGNSKEKVKEVTKELASSNGKSSKSKVAVDTGNSKQKVQEVNKEVKNANGKSSKSKISVETAQASKNVTGLKSNMSDYDRKHGNKTKKTNFTANTAGASKNVTGLKNNISSFVSRFVRTFTTTFKVVTKYSTQGSPTPASAGKRVTGAGNVSKLNSAPIKRKAPIPVNINPIKTPMTTGATTTPMATGDSTTPVQTPMTTGATTSQAMDSNLAMWSSDINNAFKYDVNLLRELDIVIQKVNNQLSITDKKMDNAIGNEKIKYLEEQNKLFREQLELQKNLENKLTRMLSVYKKFLSNEGFQFNQDGNLINYEEKLIAMEKESELLEQIAENKQKASNDYKGDDEGHKNWLSNIYEEAKNKSDKYNESLASTKKYLEEYIKVAFTDLPKVQDEFLNINKSILDNKKAIEDSNKAIEDARKEAILLKDELRKLSFDAMWTSMDKQVKQYNNELSKTNSLMENAFGSDKERLIQNKIDLYDKQIAQFQKMQNYAKNEMNNTKGLLQEFGFNFRENGDIVNYDSQIVKLKEQNKEYERAEKLISEYLDLLINKIPEYEGNIIEVNNQIKASYKDQLNVINSIEDKITSVYKKQLDDRKKLIDEELDAKLKAFDKEKEAYNDSRKEADYKNDLKEQQDAVSKLQSKIDIATRDSSLTGQKKLQELLLQMKEEQNKLQDMVQSNIDESVNKMYDNEKNRLSDTTEQSIKDLENKWSASNIADMVKNALGNNTFTDIDGNVTSLKDTMIDFLNESGEAFGVLGGIIQNDLNSNLQQAIDSFSNLDGIYSKLNLDMPKLDYSSQRYNPSALRTDTTNNNNKTIEVNFNQPLVTVQGNVSEDIMPQVEKMVKQAQDEVVKSIVSSIR